MRRARAWEELGAAQASPAQPAEPRSVARWPDAFPQYRVHHLLRTAGIEAAIARLGGLAVAGAAYRRCRHPGLHRQRARRARTPLS